MYLSQGPEGVIRQLDILGKDHVGYSAKRFKAASGQAFSVVGARPFTDVRQPSPSQVSAHSRDVLRSLSGHKG